MAFPVFVQAIADAVRPELGVQPPLKLQECNPGGQHSPLRIGCRDDVLALSFDQCFALIGGPASHVGEWLHPIFRDGKGLRESCDFVLFCERDDTLWVLLIELKTRHNRSARDQLHNTKLLVEHLLSVVEQRSGFEPPPGREFRGIVFNETCAMKAAPNGTLIYSRDARMPGLGFATVRRPDYLPVEALCAYPRR